MLQDTCPELKSILFCFRSVTKLTCCSYFFSLCDRRWSYRTAATSQRRKDRHRQQTEHLGLDNDLKEVGAPPASACCSPCWSLTLCSDPPSPLPVCEMPVSVSPGWYLAATQRPSTCRRSVINNLTMFHG